MDDDEYRARHEEVEAFRATVSDPLRAARDHCHWHAAIKRRRTAGFMEALLTALLRMAYAFEGILARGEE